MTGSVDTSGGSSGTTAGQGQNGQDDLSGLLGKVSQDINNATATDHGHFAHNGDRYVTGDVNWDGYDLPTLIGMVGPPADPAQADKVAELWRTSGPQLTQSGDNLSKALTGLASYWQGSAADQAWAAVTKTAQWISGLGATAGAMAASVEQAGGALRSAQATMSSLPISPFVANGFNPAAGGAMATRAGGPFGAATGALMGGLTSMFNATAAQATSKQQAVQTMQRYEQAALAIDTNTPQFAPPTAWTSNYTGGTPVAVGAGSTATTTTATSGSTVDSGNGSFGTGQSTVPSFADNPVGRWNALTGGGAGSLTGAGLFGAGGLGDSQASANRQKSASGSSSAAGNETGGAAGRPASSGILEDVGGTSRSTPGAPGAPGMGAPGARPGGPEGEYRRRIPFEETPFTTGLKAAPPVIGLNEVD